MIKNILLIPGLFFILSFTSTVFASVYDDFSSATLAVDKWQYPETGKHIVNGEVEMEIRAFNQDFTSTQLAFADPASKDSISAVFNISKAEHYDMTAGDFIAVGFEGSFYASVSSPDPGNIDPGDIIAGLYIMHDDPSSTTASVMYQIWVDGGSGWQMADSYTFLNKVETDTDVVLSIEYDGADRIKFSFSATVNGNLVTGVDTWYGPSSDATLNEEFKRTVVGVGGMNDKGSGHVIATIDDVQTAAASGSTYGTLALYDDFSGEGFDSARWLAGEIDLTGFCRRDIENGMMLLEAEHDNVGLANRFQFDSRLPEEKFTDFLQADIIVDPSSKITGADGNTDRGEMRLEAFWFNDTHDGSATNAYNGDVGLVAPVVKVMSFNDGRNIVRAQIYRCTNADCSTFSEIFNEAVGCSVVRGQANTFAMKKSGNTILFSCDDVTVEHSFTGNMYAHSFDVRRFRFRAYAAFGETTYYKTYIDNVFTRTGYPWAMFLPAIEHSRVKK